MSYIRTLLPRFSSARYDDAVAIARIIRAVASAPKRMIRFGIIDYDSDSILSIVRSYYQYLTLNHHLTNEDEIILHNARCLTRLCNSSSDVDIESYINKLYRLFLYVSKFLRNWNLPPIGGNLDSYANRIMFILKTGIEYERKRIMYECVIRCEYKKHVSSLYCDIFTYQPQDVKSRPLRRKKMEHFPRTLFETEWQESNRSSYILMTPENYYFPQLFLVWSDHPLKPRNLQITTICATTYKGVWITVHRNTAAI